MLFNLRLIKVILVVVVIGLPPLAPTRSYEQAVANLVTIILIVTTVILLPIDRLPASHYDHQRAGFCMYDNQCAFINWCVLNIRQQIELLCNEVQLFLTSRNCIMYSTT